MVGLHREKEQHLHDLWIPESPRNPNHFAQRFFEVKSAMWRSFGPEDVRNHILCHHEKMGLTHFCMVLIVFFSSFTGKGDEVFHLFPASSSVRTRLLCAPPRGPPAQAALGRSRCGSPLRKRGERKRAARNSEIGGLCEEDASGVTAALDQEAQVCWNKGGWIRTLPKLLFCGGSLVTSYRRPFENRLHESARIIHYDLPQSGTHLKKG